MADSHKPSPPITNKAPAAVSAARSPKHAGRDHEDEREHSRPRQEVQRVEMPLHEIVQPATASGSKTQRKSQMSRDGG